ncbi:MAG: hypothetical protein QM485_04155 [Flavobacteriaceae bacterium]
MKKVSPHLVLVFSAYVLLAECTPVSQENSTLTHVLSHNDYEQKRPLLDALEAKINSLEVDIALYNDKLYVMHHADSIAAEATFESLYLNPLRKIIEKNNGFVLEKRIPFILYINLKTKGETAWKIQQVLSQHHDIITSFRGLQEYLKPILVICGTIDDMVGKERYIVAEGNLGIPAHISPNLVYMTNLK